MEILVIACTYLLLPLKRELSNSYIYTLRLNFHPFGPKCVNLISWKSANSVDGISTFTIAYLWCLPFQANSGLPGAFSFHFLQICLKLKVTCGSLEHYLNVAYLCSFGKCLDIFLPLACWGIRHCIAWKTGALRLCARGICKYPLLLLFLLYSGEQTRTFRVFQKLNTVECCPLLLTSLAFVAFAKAMPRIKFPNLSTAHHLITCFWVTRECAHTCRAWFGR